MSKLNNKKPILFPCKNCVFNAKSLSGLMSHNSHKHPAPPPPPPPKKETVYAPNVLEEDHSLLNGDKLKIGDLIWLGRKCVITKITKTEGSKDVDVQLKITKMWYSQTEIS